MTRGAGLRGTGREREKRAADYSRPPPMNAYTDGHRSGAQETPAGRIRTTRLRVNLLSAHSSEGGRPVEPSLTHDQNNNHYPHAA